MNALAEAWGLALLRSILEAIIEWIREQGRIEVRDQIAEKEHELNTTFDRIDNSDLSADDTFGRLRSRATGAAGGLPPVGNRSEDGNGG
jgi:hypothetical protein